MKMYEKGFVILEVVAIIGVLIFIGLGLKMYFRPEYNMYDLNKDGTVDTADYEIMKKFITVVDYAGTEI